MTKQVFMKEVSGQVAGRDIVNIERVEGDFRVEGDLHHHGPAIFQVAGIKRVRERYDYAATVGPEHIDDLQKARLRELVNEIVALEVATRKEPKRHGAIWSALTAKLKVPSYHRIKAADFEKAEAWLMTWCARLRSTEAARENAPDWRNSRYAFIHGALREIGRLNDLPGLLAERYSGRRLHELGKLELETVYRVVTEWKKQARHQSAQPGPEGAGEACGGSR